ncbi:hypothetical protein H072_4526 [Dactylellina haptotyla CBS 200.50]|uniref:SGNH hydrolase-type esterase domain-containing protein n=1 Tax=Dactylellina haptotyla (strain CBS 200.50) TaxID=1284197 RepID=S8C1U3_DACHA|nr:hypothetical protein H072_4526 [Dactylellina haptotyla CBS 200.50]
MAQPTQSITLPLSMAMAMIIAYGIMDHIPEASTAVCQFWITRRPFSNETTAMLFINSLVALVATVSCASAATLAKRVHNGHWINAWATMPQLTEPANLPPAPFNGTSGVFVNATIRQTLFMTIGADQIRIRISNVFGVNDLPISAVSVALPVDGAAGVSGIQTSTLKQVTFSGSSSIIVPNGALVVSDPIDFKIAPLQNIAVSIYLASGQQGFSITSHPGSRTTSWMTFGNQINAAAFTSPDTANVAHWYFLSAVEAWVNGGVSSFVIVGDSITDGRGSTTNGNNRWPDLLLRNMQKQHFTRQISVSNEAAGGNRILNDGLGPNAQGRIERDVLAQPGVKFAMIFEGVNDIGTAAATAEVQEIVYQRLILAFKQIATRVHTFKIPLFVATITPFGSPDSVLQPYSAPAREVTRLRINDWIRKSKGTVFDAVIDFDALLRDPKNATQLNPIYDSGDQLHPSLQGYQYIADKFPLDLFDKFENGVDGFN